MQCLSDHAIRFGSGDSTGFGTRGGVIFFGAVESFSIFSPTTRVSFLFATTAFFRKIYQDG
jgi:hypothetical protein